MQSYLSPKTVVKKSAIEGKGLFCRKPIHKGEIIGIKSGQFLTGEMVKKLLPKFGDAYLQITEDLFLGPSHKQEVPKSMMYLNHSCNPNVGMQGNIVFVAMRMINPGEELTIDYATVEDEADEVLLCHCGSKQCRKMVTGKDWMKKELQRKYNGYFSAFIQKKIRG